MTNVITINSTALTALLTSLQQRTGNMQPIFSAIGEDIMERTKQRFATGTAPDGTPWTANSQATLMRYLNKNEKKSPGKIFSAKSSKISAKGKGLAMSKRPLIGESGSLAQQFHVSSDANGVTVGSTMRYAAMQQFGGKKGQFKQLWGDIPARPFLPVTPGGTLYPGEETRIIDTLRNYLAV